MPQELTVYVPDEYQLPRLYSTLTEKQTALVLSLGAYAYEVIQTHGVQLTHEELTQQMRESAAATYEPQLSSLQHQLGKLKEHLQDEQERRLGTEQRVREEERRNRDDILREKDHRIQSLEVQLKELSHTIRDSSTQMVSQFQSFKDQLVKTTTSSKKKGEIGEAVFESIVERAFGGESITTPFTIENVGKEGHQGDLRMNWRGHHILLEVKHYDRNVDGKEVAKFLRDMEAAKDCPIGMMISLTTGITGHMKAGKVDIEMLHDGRICMYLNSFLQHDDSVSFLQSLKPCMEAFLVMIEKTTQSQQSSSSHTDRVLELFQQQRASLLKVIQSHEEQTRKMKNVLMNAKKKHEQSWIEILGEMRESEHRMKLLMETILDFSIEDMDEDTKGTDQQYLPGYVFRHTDLAMYTAKERAFVEDTLREFTFHEESRMSTKDVKEIYKTLGYSDDALLMMRSCVFQDSVWERGKKDVKYLQRRTHS